MNIFTHPTLFRARRRSQGLQPRLHLADLATRSLQFAGRSQIHRRSIRQLRLRHLRMGDGDRHAAASAATRASSRARPKITCRSSDLTRSLPCRDMHWLRIDDYTGGGQPRLLSQSPACIASMRRASRFVLLPRPSTTARVERPGLQSLRRHALLRIQLPLQSAPLQFLRLCRRPGIRRASAPISSRRSLTRMSRSAAAASWRNAPIASSASVAARRAAEKENRAIRDGEVVTACQAACPTQAINFGDLNDPRLPR